MDRIPVYFVPGLGANPLIFEFIELPKNEFECIYLEWEVPLDGETLKEYAGRLCAKITHHNPVLIGVSFGGIMVQEMADIIDVDKVIIISSAKSTQEYPRLFKFAKYTRAYNLVSTWMLIRLGGLAKFPVFGRKINERLRLYKRYLGMRSKKYWDWSIRNIIYWDRDVPNETVIHIHGDKDEIFPAKRIKNYISIKDGTHIMLIIRHKWLSENLPNIIRHGRIL